MANKCSYTYSVVRHRGYLILVLVDANDGSLSLTNGIEDVIDELRLNLIPFPDFVIYKDTDGAWDGWDYKGNDFIFIFLNTDEKEDALDKIVDYYESIQ